MKPSGQLSVGVRTSRVRTLRTQVTDHLRLKVLSGTLAAGERVTEASLADELGVGRGPIRDALLQLSQEGVLTHRPNCSAEVASPADGPVRELLVKLRREIEVFSLKARFASLASGDCERLLAGLNLACEAGDLSAVVEHDIAFHRWIVEQSGQTELPSIWLAVVMRLRLVYSRHTNLKEVYAEHLKIVKAIRDGNKKQAVRALAEHIQ